MAREVFWTSEAVYDDMLTHAQDGKPEEVCGILRGRGDRAFELVRGHNVAPDPVNDFVIDTKTLLRQFGFEETGDEMVAIYHSHPISPAYPSASDAWNAHYPDCAYLICSLEDCEAPVVRAFGLTGHDIELDLDELCTALDFDETRPGRFAYYQKAGAPIPAVLRATCAHIPAPFYIVFETSEQLGKDPVARVVSVLEYALYVTSD